MAYSGLGGGWFPDKDSGGIVTGAQNGLSVVGTIVELGGNPLLHDTDIPLAGFDLTLSGLGNFGVGTVSPATEVDVNGSIRSIGAAGASGGTGTELYSGGLLNYNYSLGIYDMDLNIDALSVSISNQGVQKAQFINSRFGVGITPTAYIDSAFSVRGLGAAGATTGNGTEVYSGGIRRYNYTGAAYSSAMDIDSLNITISNSGVQSANYIGGNYIIGKVAAPGARVDVWGSNNANGTYGLRINGSTNADILNVQNGGRVGVNTINSSALSIQSLAADTTQIISYSNAFRIGLQVIDNGGGAVGDAYVSLGSGAFRADTVTGNTAISAAPNATNRLFIKSRAATNQDVYVESIDTLGNVVIGFTANDAYMTMMGSTLGGTRVSIQTNADSFFTGGNTSFGINTSNARVQIKGAGNTSASYALRVDSSTVADIFVVRNDGWVGRGISAPLSKFDNDGSTGDGAITTSAGSPTLDETHNMITIDASGGNRTVNLPTAVGINRRVYIIKKIDSSANTVTVQANGAQTIDGANTYVISDQYDTIAIKSDNANWHIISDNQVIATVAQINAGTNNSVATSPLGLQTSTYGAAKNVFLFSNFI